MAVTDSSSCLTFSLLQGHRKCDDLLRDSAEPLVHCSALEGSGSDKGGSKIKMGCSLLLLEALATSALLDSSHLTYPSVTL